MARFNNRRAPNLFQPIASLSTIPSAHVSTQQDENYSTGNNLAVFASPESNDFDLGAGIAELPLYFGAALAIDPTYHPFPPLAATSASSFNYPYPPSTSSSTSPPDHPPHMSATAPTRTPTLPPASSLNAEQDKLHRNTAASARCRAKKREREHTLERTTEELRIRVNELENLVVELKRERKLLREIVVGRKRMGSLESAAPDRGAAADTGEGGHSSCQIGYEEAGASNRQFL